MGQVRKTQHQIQNELDDIHHLISQGASDDYIMKSKNIERRQYYRYKQKLYNQTAKMYAEKRAEDIFYDIQICKERLSHDRVNAAAKANETSNPVWGQLASELAVSILRLETEGIKALNNKDADINNRTKQLEEKNRPILLNGSQQPPAVFEVEPQHDHEQQQPRSESEPSPDDPSF